MILVFPDTLSSNPEHRFAVIELGANHIGEIAYTVNMVKPDMNALVNNLFSAHIEGFGSLQGIAQAKGEIFTGLKEQGTAIINQQSNDVALWQQRFNSRQTSGLSLYLQTLRPISKRISLLINSPPILHCIRQKV